MSEGRNVSTDPNEDGPAGTDCALCGTDINPTQYRSARAILVDESGTDGDEEVVKMVCEDCWAELDGDLSTHSA
jgi:hypothetical protein